MFKVRVKKDRMIVTRVKFDHTTRSNKEEPWEEYKVGDTVSFLPYYGRFGGGKRDIEVAPLGATGIVIGARNIAYRETFDFDGEREYYQEWCLMVIINASQNPLPVPLSDYCSKTDEPFKPWHTNGGYLKCQMKEAHDKHPEWFPRDSKGRFK